MSDQTVFALVVVACFGFAIGVAAIFIRRWQ